MKDIKLTLATLALITLLTIPLYLAVEHNRKTTALECVQSHGYTDATVVSSIPRGRGCEEFSIDAKDTDGKPAQLLVIVGGFRSATLAERK